MSDFAEIRLTICGVCPYNESGDCILCGCNIPVKVIDPNEMCPLTPPSWNKVDLSTPETKKGAESTGQITAQPTPPPRTVCIPCNRR